MGHVELDVLPLQQGGAPEKGGQSQREGERAADVGQVAVGQVANLSYSVVDQPQHGQVGSEEGDKEQAGDVVGQEQGSQGADADQKPTPVASQGQAAKGPQDEREERQRDRFGSITAQEGVEELIGGVGISDGSDNTRPGAEQVAGQQVGGDGGADDAQDVDSVEGRRKRQAGQIKRQGQVVGESGAVVKERVAVAKGQVGEVAGEEDAVLQGVTHGGDTKVVQGAVVGARGIGAEEGDDGGGAQED